MADSKAASDAYKHKGELINREDCIKKISSLCREYNDIIGLVILFGSVARGENTEYSDIDLYVEPNSTKITTCGLFKKARFREFEESLFEMYPDNDYDILVFGGVRDIEHVKKSLLWEQIQKDGVKLHDKVSVKF